MAAGTVKHLRELSAGYRAIGRALPVVRQGLRAAGESVERFAIVAKSALYGFAAAAEASNKAALGLLAAMQGPRSNGGS